jgi:acyl-CoA-dependent ceramide synthase
LTHVCFPSLRSSTIQYFTLSYYDAQSGLYNPGWQDLKFVSLCIIVFTALRAAAMDYALVPMARKCGIHKKKATIRFAEQAWLVLYYATFWSLGTVRIITNPMLCPAIANTQISISYMTLRTSTTCPQCGQLSRHAP